MMWHKALLFGDRATAEQILAAPDPGAITVESYPPYSAGSDPR